jgi:hypothetical protein
MESIKKIISLNEAAKMSGYTQDYLGFLIRKGEIKGVKKGRAWFTTEEEINNYLFKRNVRQNKFAIKGFFSPTRLKNIIIAAIIIFIGGYFWFSYFNKKNVTPVNEIKSAVTSDGGAIKITN